MRAKQKTDVVEVRIIGKGTLSMHGTKEKERNGNGKKGTVDITALGKKRKR